MMRFKTIIWITLQSTLHFKNQYASLKRFCWDLFIGNRIEMSANILDAGMHLGCAIGQMAQKNNHGRTFRKTVRPSWRTVLPSGALCENGCARLFTCSLYFLIKLFPFTWSISFFVHKVHVGQRQEKSVNFTNQFSNLGKSENRAHFGENQGHIRWCHYG